MVFIMESFIYYVYIFFIYSFIGWAQEVLQTLIKSKKFVNRGFLIGPICPVYGFGSMLITFFLGKHTSTPFYIFTGSIFICCVLEYFTSYILEKLFKARWWDYTNMKYNINGRICLECGLAFGLGSLLILYIVNPYIIDAMFNNVNFTLLKIIAFTLIFILFVDTLVSFNIIFNLKNISNNIRSDNTEQITKEVKKILAKSTLPYRRLLESFPNMEINNSMSLIKKRLVKQKDKYLQRKKANRKEYMQVKRKLKNKNTYK